MTDLDRTLREQRRCLESARQIQSETDEQRAKRIEIHNHLWQVSQGHNYRCMSCGRKSAAVLWVDMHTCPLCGEKYDPILAMDEEE